MKDFHRDRLVSDASNHFFFLQSILLSFNEYLIAKRRMSHWEMTRVLRSRHISRSDLLGKKKTMKKSVGRAFSFA